jgi:hypothetical protein
MRDPHIEFRIVASNTLRPGSRHVRGRRFHKKTLQSARKDGPASFATEVGFSGRS